MNPRLLDRWCALLGIRAEPGGAAEDEAEARLALCRAMSPPGEPPPNPRTLAELELRPWRLPLPAVQVVDAANEAIEVECRLPVEPAGREVRWVLELEEGGRREGRFGPADLRCLETRSVGEQTVRRCLLPLRPAPPPGYHRFRLEDPAGEPVPPMALIVAPARCYQPEALAEGRPRHFGIALQLAAVRTQHNWGAGDFTDLRGLVDFAADRGAALVGLCSLAALRLAGPADLTEPSSRLFFHLLHLDLEAVPECAESEAARHWLTEPEVQARLRALRAGEEVACRELLAAKLELAALLYRQFRDHHLPGPSARGADFLAWQAARGMALERQVRFDALSEHFAGTDAEHGGWTHWPLWFRDPESPAVAEFAAAHAERTGLFAYLYWLADAQMEAAGRRSLEQGLTVGLGLDFCFDVAADGAEAWAGQALHPRGVRLGLAPAGPGPALASGLSPWLPEALKAAAYGPFIAALRQAMGTAGALFLRRAGQLQRQWWLPEGSLSGAWVEFPAADLLPILALESQRNRCLVVAGDPRLSDDLRAGLDARGILPLRSFLAESADLHGGAGREFRPSDAVAAGGADEPTLRGFWLGRDLEEKSAFGLFGSEADRQEQSVERAAARARLLVALEREGLLPPEVTLSPLTMPDLTADLLAAVHRHLCKLPARLVLMRMSDGLGQTGAAALPGAPPAYPNWRRKLPLELEQWRKEPGLAKVLDALAEECAGAAAAPAKPRPGATGGVVHTVPRATYRLQLNRDFDFRKAADLVPYLEDLGISHCYASPYLKARPGSSHGYDIVDHAALNPELGSRADFERFVRELGRCGMGHILDLVPNHMGVGGSDNAWWQDVLENGEASQFAGYFDIDWHPVKESLRGRVLLPILGSPYGTALENGEIELVFDPEEGSLAAWYGPHLCPIDPKEYPRILGHRPELLEAAIGADSAGFHEFQSLLTAFGHLPGRWQVGEAKRAERQRDKEVHKRHLARLCGESQDVARFIARSVSEFNGTPGVPGSFDRLHDLLEHQAYRLAYWRIAADEINYRRFFDNNELAALAMENEAVFRETHRLVLGLVAEGKLHGLRIDHPDGLYDPDAYFRRLQAAVAALADGGTETGQPEFYVVAEKILEFDEDLPDWPIAGTTGYDFANLVNGLWLPPGAEPVLDEFYRQMAGLPVEFDDLLYHSRRLILKVALSAELTVLANGLGRIAEADRRTRDYSLTGLRDALREVIASFPVYRTYITENGASERDRAYVEMAVEEAKRRSPVGDLSVFDFIRDVLLLVQGEGKSERYRAAILAFAMKFQQVTGPVMAKGMEDTLFYRYLRLVSLNEVGGDPRRFAVSAEVFHRRNRDRAARWPDALLSTSTHDTKRSEDVRARIAVIAEMPEAWVAAVGRWGGMNRRHKTWVDGGFAPADNDEYLIYQTLLGTWPAEAMDPAGAEDYRARLEAYLLKSMREAKLYSSWLNPHLAYEEAALRFLRAILEPAPDNPFPADFLAVEALTVRPGFRNSLGQVLLKLTAPGVPDFYQGNELWDFSLVDPDNRRPVDFRRRRALLAELSAWDELDADALAAHLAGLTERMEDGRIKFFLTRATLRLRQRREALFRRGGYRPLRASGPRAAHVLAFARKLEGDAVIVAVPRWTRRLLAETGRLGDAAAWQGTAIELPAELNGRYRNACTRRAMNLDARLAPEALFADFPVALLAKEE